jgi:dimethylargininase
MLEVASFLVREISPRFAACVRRDASQPIDVARARAQHAAYVRALAQVAEVRVVAAAAEHPDCVFIEDTAVVLDASQALITQPGAASRVGEPTGVAPAIAGTLHRMLPPATLDGGDVLRVADRLFIGLSTRTNEAGAHQLAELCRRAGLVVLQVEVPAGLHLKSACSLADESTLLYDPRVGLDLAPFRDAGLDCMAAPEPLGANVLALGRGRVLASASAPRTIELLSARDLEVTALEMSELHAADGALTCCSLRFPPPGAWCT